MNETVFFLSIFFFLFSLGKKGETFPAPNPCSNLSWDGSAPSWLGGGFGGDGHPVPHPTIPTAATFSPSFQSKSLFFSVVVHGMSASGKVTMGKSPVNGDVCSGKPGPGLACPSGQGIQQKTFAFLPPRWKMDLFLRKILKHSDS